MKFNPQFMRSSFKRQHFVYKCQKGHSVCNTHKDNLDSITSRGAFGFVDV